MNKPYEVATMERTDNIHVWFPDSKKDLLDDWVNGVCKTSDIYQILTVNVVDFTIVELNTLPVSEVMAQVSQDHIVWLVKEHV